jgi:hypothetical protein
MAAAVPISLCSALGRKATAIALAAAGATALVRLVGLASDAAPSHYPPQPSRLANMFAR